MARKLVSNDRRQGGTTEILASIQRRRPFEAMLGGDMPVVIALAIRAVVVVRLNGHETNFAAKGKTMKAWLASW
jgi:hypothetical protein